MVHAVEESYEEMINYLKEYKQQVVHECGVMLQAGLDCIENTEDDSIVIRNVEALKKNVVEIGKELGQIDGIIQRLINQLERLRRLEEKMGLD